MNWVWASRHPILTAGWLAQPEEARLLRPQVQHHLQDSFALRSAIAGSNVPVNMMHGSPVPTLHPAGRPDIGEVEEPLAELCAVGKRCVSAQDIKSVEALVDWLQDRLPANSAQQISDWGKLPGTKRVANLWLELLQGEISLEDSIPPRRTVHVASVKISNGSGKMLLEAYQEMADGTMRQRNRPLSEKMKPGESVEDACLRGIKEELGHDYGAPQCVQMLLHTYEKQVQERESFSYPGLLTCYVLHQMVAVMKDLPGEDFVTEENELSGNAEEDHTSQSRTGEPTQARVSDCLGDHNSAIGVRRHFWKWVPEQTP